MANSKYEYVKEVGYERECVVMPGNIIVVRLEFHDFRRFSELHEFERPNDMNAVGLMNCCARAVLEQFPDVCFSYGYRDEYSFVFKRGTEFYQRRAREILSLTVSFFTSMYVTKWKELFPEKDLRVAPSFLSRVICCPTLEILQAYLGWRQSECHSINQHDTCLWQLIKSGKSEKEAEAVLMVSQKQDRNDLLFHSFKINYTKDVPLIFRQGTCTLHTEVEEVESRDDDGVVKRLRRKIITVHSKNIASRRFWNDQPCLVKELGQYTEDLNKPKPDYIKAFQPVKEVGYEREFVVMPGNIIVVRLEFRDFRRFSELHEFERPNDMNAVGLMNCCARVVLEQFPDVFFSYGYRDEYSFVFKRGTKFYQRRASKILSLTVSFFTSMYVTKWKEFFPEKDLRFAPSFLSRVICCPTLEILQAYLGWRQSECHSINQHDTCLWQLIKSGKSEKEAEAVLMVSQKQDRNELLFQSFKINYTEDVPLIFRQGTCTLNTEVEEVESRDDGGVVKRLRRKIITVHSDNIASRRFWNDQPCLVKELGRYTDDLNKPNPDYIKAFQLDCCFEPCLASTYIVVRVDGCHFHRFSDVHEFEKPNDMQALNLMNSCAAGVLEEFKDIVFSYGVSDEYSFVLKKESRLYERRVSDIVSAIVSLFSSLYTKKWKEFFPDKEMKYTPYFDGRVACYPTENIRDYLAWRQVDCHINNQYNTCFWMLVKSGKSKSDAQKSLKGTQTQQKNILLDDLTGVSDYYSTLPLIFRNGSFVYWEKEKNLANSEEDSVCKTRKIVVVKYCNIIDASFWEAHPEILNEKVQLL